ncbi:hypothetical protein [Mastigocoleus testarum]|nr:hypothetical protein [Mastigocoleus testarum]
MRQIDFRRDVACNVSTGESVAMIYRIGISMEVYNYILPISVLF